MTLGGNVASARFDRRVKAPWFVIPYHPDQSKSQEYLAESVSSIVEQTDDHWKLVIVHDPVLNVKNQESFLKDLTASISDRTSILSLDTRIGPGGARNAGVAWAVEHGADTVIFLDADDVCEPHRLASLRASLESNPRVGMAYSSFSIIDEDSKPREQGGLASSLREIIASQAENDTILCRPWREMACKRGYMSLTSTVAARASVAIECQFPLTTVSEDAHTWLRMFATCEEIAYIADPLARYRVPRVPGGSASRERSGGAFYWSKALVDADACFRVLVREVASGLLSLPEALDALDEFWRRTGSTLNGVGNETAASIAWELSSKRCRGGVDMPHVIR